MNRRLFLLVVGTLVMSASAALAADLTHTKDSLDVVKAKSARRRPY